MSDNEQKAPVLGAEGGLVKPKGQPETSTKTSSAADGSDATSMEQFVETLADALKRNTGTTEQDIRRNVRPPRAYSVGHNFKTWLAQFNQFAQLVRIRDADKKPYLLTLLDTPAFRAVEMLKLPDTLTFGEFTAKLVERFDSGKTKADYKHQLRARLQKPNEDIEAYADCLMELAENAYLDTDYSFKVELARDQFVQGVAISEEMRERVYDTGTFLVGGAEVPIHYWKEKPSVCRVLLTDTAEMEPGTERVLGARLEHGFKQNSGSPGIVEGVPASVGGKIGVARSLVVPKGTDVLVRLANFSDDPIKLPANSLLGQYHPLNSDGGEVMLIDVASQQQAPSCDRVKMGEAVHKPEVERQGAEERFDGRSTISLDSRDLSKKQRGQFFSLVDEIRLTNSWSMKLIRLRLHQLSSPQGEFHPIREMLLTNSLMTSWLMEG